MTAAQASLGRVLLRLEERPGPLETACWVWPGARSRQGYGYVRVGGRGGKIELVHVLAYRVLTGVKLRGRLVHHRCETPLCANPAHLEAVTRRQHALRHRRDRFPAGHRYDARHGHRRVRVCRRCRNDRRRAAYAAAG